MHHCCRSILGNDECGCVGPFRQPSGGVMHVIDDGAYVDALRQCCLGLSKIMGM